MVTRSEIGTNGGPCGGCIVRQRRSVEPSTPRNFASSSVVTRSPDSPHLLANSRLNRAGLDETVSVGVGLRRWGGARATWVVG